VRFAAIGGSTVSDASTSSAPIVAETTVSPWANDHNFIAPAQ
jgi:hypothetical protein